jgi:hypothetical protein
VIVLCLADAESVWGTPPWEELGLMPVAAWSSAGELEVGMVERWGEEGCARGAGAPAYSSNPVPLMSVNRVYAQGSPQPSGTASKT